MKHQKDNLDRALTLLRDFIFPLKDSLVQADKNSICEFMVSLHEQNESYPNGLTINERIFEIQKIDEEHYNSVANQIFRYLCNIEIIRLEVDIRLGELHKTDSIEVKFAPDVYIISKLNKSFKYGELPSADDVESLISDFLIE